MPIEVEDLGLNGAMLVKPKVFGDERGFFMETYRREEYWRAGIEIDEVQMNRSRSNYGVLRAIHFQIDPGQPKLVSCTLGAIVNVAVDLRRGSPTYGSYKAVGLSETNGHQLYLPVGFGNGFVVVSDVADYSYIVGSYYDPATESQIAWDDPDIGINWPVIDPIVSERDLAAVRLTDFDWSGCTWQQ